ncbi:hypothetical protein [Vibrio mexicanus]|uniref:hypothetical protein n=1 Tax=Vibrio mexicanus TaxID=1004326 RepID=UPI00063C2443|nr:hypothetical protein [Vibrio mexicanus]
MSRENVAIIYFSCLLIIGCNGRASIENSAYNHYFDGLKAYQSRDYLAAKQHFQLAKIYIPNDETFIADEILQYSNFECTIKCEYQVTSKGRAVQYQPNHYLNLINRDITNDAEPLDGQFTQPARIKAILQIQTHTKDNRLRAGEAAKLILQVQNIGRGSARDLNVYFTSSSAHISIQPNANVGLLKPGETATLTFPISQHIKGPKHRFDVDARFADSYTKLAGEVHYTYSSQALSYKKPRLTLKDPMTSRPIIAHYNNHKQLSLCNKSKHPAFGLKISMTADGLAEPATIKNGDIPLLHPNQCRIFDAYFRPNTQLKRGAKIGSQVIVTDVNGEPTRLNPQLKVEQSLFADTIITSR